MIVSCGESLADILQTDGAAPVAAPGGGPMNVAIAAARLGVPGAFVGRVSTDDYGGMIWNHLVENGVDVSACERGDEPTARAIVEHVPELRFRFEGDGTADTCLTAVDLSPFQGGPYILHGGTLGLFRGRTAGALAAAAEKHAGLVSVDPNVRPQIIQDRPRWHEFHERWIRCADVYRGSDEDFAWIWPDLSVTACAELLLGHGCKVVMVTRGADGVSVFTDRHRFDVAGRSVDVVDTVGAGDTFVAAVLVGLHRRGLAGEPDALARLDEQVWRRIAEFAIAASAITCTRTGADPPRLDEVGARSDQFGDVSP